MLSRSSATALLLTCVCCAAQQQPAEAPHLSVRTAPQFLIRIELAHLTLEGSAHTCLIVYPDQSFHMEKSQKAPSAPAKTTFATDGMLTRDEQIQVASIIGDPELEKLNASSVTHKPYNYAKGFDEVFASIPRSNTKVQSLAAAASGDEVLDPAVKTLTALVETINARKPAEVKNARHDNCHEPNPARPLQK